MISITVNGTDYDVPSSAADTNWAAKQVAYEQAVATYLNSTGTAVAAVAAQVVPLIWVPLATFANSWANFGAGMPLATSLDVFGNVWVRGDVSAGANGTLAFTLSSGRRPPVSMIATSYCDSGVARIDVGTTGAVVIDNLTAGANCSTITSLNFYFSTIDNA